MLPASEIYKHVRVYSDTPQTIFTLQASGLDIDHSYREPGKWIEFAVSESRIHILDATQLSYDIIHEDLESFYASRLDSDYESRDFDLGSMVKNHRKKAGLTQLELANLAGVGKTTVFDIEKNKETEKSTTSKGRWTDVLMNVKGSWKLISDHGGKKESKNDD